MKRYFAVIWPKRRTEEAALLAGYERDGRVFSRGRRIGFALDYYADEVARYKRELGRAIVGDYATRQEAESAIARALEGAAMSGLAFHPPADIFPMIAGPDSWKIALFARQARPARSSWGG